MKEMVGGCCVCSDESGWDENPLVYCDGDGCDVAVHQACYGIVSVPVGPWFCRKCESQDRSAITRCELCPGKGGALKQTDSGGWAHVVCALYIPEVRFGDVATMEPVLLSHLPPDRFGKPCCLCEVAGRTSRATTGATMSCNKPGCRQNFHVTCAQSQGLLCEEQVQSMNVTYCGYCPHHYAKLKRGHNLKPIPAFKASHDPATPDTSPEKQPPPPGGDGPRAERRHKKPKQSRSPRAAAASPPEVGASPAVGGQGAAPFPQAVVKLEPVGPLGMDGAAAVHSSLGGAAGGEVTPARVLGGQDGAPDSVSADNRDGSGIKQETGVEQPPPVALLPAAGGAAGQVASLPVATSTALPAAQQAVDVDSASLKRPAVPADGDARKRKATGRPRKGAAGAGSPEPGADGTWNGAVGTDAAQPAGSATARGGAAALAPSGLTAPHMIGNHLNPAAPLGDSLAAEMAEQADYLEPIGRMAATPGQWRPDTAAAPFPRSLTELLERQWQQGSHFLMEQSQHMDIAALLSCLYQLRQENEQLEQHMGVVSQRRDHLLAVHARLSVPLQCAAPGVVSARAAAVRQQQAANDAELNGGPVSQLRSTPPRPAPMANGQLTEGGQPAAPAPAPARAPPQTNGRSSGPASVPPPAPAAPQPSPAHGGLSSGRPGPAPQPQPPPPAPVSRPPVSTSAPPPASRPQPAASRPQPPVSRPQTSASRPQPPASEHRTVEALRLRVSATSSGGFPQYQLVSPPSDGRSGSGRSRASDG